MKHRLLSLLLVLALVLAVVPATVFADEIPLTWSAADGVLTVSGSEIPDYSAEDPAPWCVASDDYDPASVRAIVVSDGVTAIGASAFAALENAESVALPASLAELGADALPLSLQGAAAAFGDETITFGADAVTIAPTAPVSDREGYDAVWGGFTLRKDETAAVEAVYVPITYHATFLNGEETVAVVDFTVEDTALAEPDVPAKAGYTGAWESYTLGAGDITVQAVYSLATYTVTFVAGDKTVAQESYTIEDPSITAPAVPARSGYTGAWESYTLGASDLTVKAVYKPITYYATFQADGKTVAKVPFTVETTKLSEPSVPAKAGYKGVWSSYKLGAGSITVKAVYTFVTYTGTVTASYLNVRSAASTSASIAGGLSRGASVTITAEQTDAGGMKWGKLASGGWVSLTYVQKNAAGSGSSSGGSSTKYTATVTASSLNVRSGPGTGYGIQGALARGASVTFVEQSAAADGTTWCRLSTGGWVSKAYLGSITAVPSSGGSSGSSGGSSGSSSGSSSGFTRYTATVSASVLNVRSGPSTANGVVGTLRSGASVTVEAESADGKWAKISNGWVSKDYLINRVPVSGSQPSAPAEPSKPAQPESTTGRTVMVTASSLNVRSGPGTGYARTGSLSNGTVVTVVKTQGDWGQLSTGGWICMTYVVDTAPPFDPSTITGTFSHVYSTYTTNCSTSSAARKTNLILACQAINGTILQPGGIFSFNNVVGQRTPEKGYQLAPYIGPGSLTYGGGVCQVASTVFNAALLANLNITSRTQHSSRVSYVPLGRDATVNWGTLDFCFRNSSDLYIQLYAHCDGNTVTVSIMTRENVNPGNVTLQVAQSGTRFTLYRYYNGAMNYSTVSVY